MNWGFVIGPCVVAAFAVGYWLGQRRGQEIMDRIQKHTIPLDQFGRLDFTFTDRASLAIIDNLTQAGLIQPIPNEKNRLILSEWPVPPDSYSP